MNRDTTAVSVVVCVLNEEERIDECLASVVACGCDEIIVVDGGSKDRTVAIAKQYPVTVIESHASNLTRDRQIGIDAARNRLIAMIDADHRLREGDIQSLVNDLDKYELDIVQSQLVPDRIDSFWNAAEADAWSLAHNSPGRKKMIGTAPAVFKREIFDSVRFDDHITWGMDDTDFMYRLSKIPGIHVGVGETQIRQQHMAGFLTYLRKFRWYGRGDAQFSLKHPRRAASMIFHLLVRYPVLYSWKAMRARKWKAVPFFVLQGLTRFYWMQAYFVREY